MALSVSWVFTVMAAACTKLLLHHCNPQNKLDEVAKKSPRQQL
jgi:hypothetical protein